MTPATFERLAGLAEPLRSRVAALLARTGDAVWIVSGRRSTEEQVQLRRAHCGTSFYDIYQRPSSQCSPPTARPGHSKHETGLAVDLGGDLALAAKVAPKVGLERTVPGERWHYEPDNAVTDAQLLAGGDPGIIDIIVGSGPGGVILGGAGDPISDAVSSALSSALGGLVEPFLAGGRRIALTGLLVAGGVALVVLGGIRGTGLTKEITAS